MFSRISGLLMAASLIATPLLRAQAGPPPAAVQRMEQISKQLNLSEQQKEKIMPILIEEAPKVQALKNDAAMPRNEKVAKMLEVRNETSDKIRPLLNSSQQKKLDQMRQQQRQQILQELKSKG